MESNSSAVTFDPDKPEVRFFHLFEKIQKRKNQEPYVPTGLNILYDTGKTLMRKSYSSFG